VVGPRAKDFYHLQRTKSIGGSDFLQEKQVELPLPRARYLGVSRFRNRASKKKKHSELDLWASLPKGF